MVDVFDLEALVSLEQTFYDEGFKDGFAHGRIHGLIEGRALGREKGFEMWEELGFYEGFALMWKAIYTAQNRPDDRALHRIKHLLDLIAQFPRVNPSSTPSPSSTTSATLATETESETTRASAPTPPPIDSDIPKLFRQIRSRYKVLCSALGVRPSLRAADGTPADNIEMDNENHVIKPGNAAHDANPATAINLSSTSSAPTRAKSIWHWEESSSLKITNTDQRGTPSRVSGNALNY